MKASKTITITVQQLLDGKHPAVIIRKKVVANKGTIAVGQVVAISNGAVLPYIFEDVTAGTVFGVATQTANTATGNDTAINVLVHGTCKAAMLTVVGGEAATQVDLDALGARGVWALN